MAHAEVAERYSILLGNRGRLVLPAEVRRRLDFQDGDRRLDLGVEVHTTR